MPKRHAKGDRIEILLISNTLYPYLIHNISILSVPAGITYRFRYEVRHFENNNVENLTGKLGLFVLFDTGEKAYIPLRTFRFFRVENFGDYVFLELEFLDYVKYDLGDETAELKEKDKETRKAMRLARLAPSRHKHSEAIKSVLTDKGETAAGKLILSTDPCKVCGIEIDDRSRFAETLKFWSIIVKLLGGIDYYADNCFYRIAAIRDIGSDKDAPFFEGEKRKGFKLYAGRTYLMQVFQLMSTYASPPPPGFKIEIQSIAQHILPLRSSEIVDGPYDRLEFLFYVLPQEMRRVNSFLAVENSQRIEDPKKTEPIAVELKQLIESHKEKDSTILKELGKLLEDPSTTEPIAVELKQLIESHKEKDSTILKELGKLLEDPSTTEPIAVELKQLVESHKGKDSTILKRLGKLLEDGSEDDGAKIPPSLMQIRIKWTKWEFVRKVLLPIPVGIIAVGLYYLSKEIGHWLATTFELAADVRPEFIQLFAFILLAWSAGNWTTFTGAFKAQSASGPKA
jgi:hypothetical protein